MIPVELYYRKAANGKARLECLESKPDEPEDKRYALMHSIYDKDTGELLPEVELARFTLEDVIAEKKRLKDRVDLLARMQADIELILKF